MALPGHVLDRVGMPTHRDMNATRAHTGCTACGSSELLSVSITMADGPVRFWTCSTCEATSWERHGARLTRDSALSHLPRR
jgi:hypothetical protein